MSPNGSLLGGDAELSQHCLGKHLRGTFLREVWWSLVSD